MKLEIYGKRSWMKNQINFFTVYDDKRYSDYLSNQSLQIYRPSVNRIKATFGGMLIVGCLVTPFTNFFIPSILRWSVA